MTVTRDDTWDSETRDRVSFSDFDRVPNLESPIVADIFSVHVESQLVFQRSSPPPNHTQIL